MIIPLGVNVFVCDMTRPVNRFNPCGIDRDQY